MVTRQNVGFTLLEMLLVLVIVAALLVIGMNYMQQKATAMRIDRTALQMQQILNAGLAYYVSNGKWPCDPGQYGDTNCSLDRLKADNYLPNTSILSPWGQVISMGVASAGSPSPTGQLANFYVYTKIPAINSSAVIANVIAGRLPMAYTTRAVTAMPPATTPACSSGINCYVVTSVTIPGQNLNNASAINFAGIYNHGGCVPVPSCPASTTPQIMVAPASVSGFGTSATAPTADAFTGTPPNATPNVYPISSFTAYATGPDAAPPSCDNYVPACGGTPSGLYWRVCAKIVTEKGTSNLTLLLSASNKLADGITLIAFTRCAITGEPAGSTYKVFTTP